MLRSDGEEESGEGFSYGQSCRRLALFTSSKHFPNEQRKALFIGKSPTEATRRARHEYECETYFSFVFLSAALDSCTSLCAQVIEFLCAELHDAVTLNYDGTDSGTSK